MGCENCFGSHARSPVIYPLLCFGAGYSPAPKHKKPSLRGFKGEVCFLHCEPVDNLGAAVSMFENLVRAVAGSDGCRNGNLVPIAGKRDLSIARTRLPMNLVGSCR